MVQVSVCWCGQFQCSKADVVESLVINTVGFISVLNKLVDGQCSIVGFNDGV